MVSPIAHSTQAPTAAAPSAATVQPAPQAKGRPAQAADKVTLSAAASLRQELTETSVQTAKEAGHGDIQARNLLAREAADKAAGG
jgi:hypothetical protein